MDSNSNIESLLSRLVDAQQDMADRIIDRFDRLEGGMVRMYEQMGHIGRNQMGQTFGSAMSHTGASVNKFGGGQDLGRTIESSIRQHGRFMKGLEGLMQKFDEGNRQLDESNRKRQELLQKQDELNEQLKDTSKSEDELNELRDKVRSVASELGNVAESTRNLRKQQEETVKAMYEWGKQNPEAVKQGEKRGERRREYEHYQSTHKLTKYKDFDSYNRHMDTMETTNMYRNDVQTAQDMFNRSGLGNNKFGTAVNKGFDFINQGLNTWDTISQVKSMFGKGGGGAGGGGNPFSRLIGGGGGTGEGVAVAGEGGTAMAEAGAAAGEAAGAMGETAAAAEAAAGAAEGLGTAAAGAEAGMVAGGTAASGMSAGLMGASASLGPFGIALVAAIVAINAFAAATQAANKLNSESMNAQAESAQMEADYQVTQAQAEADKTVANAEYQANLEMKAADIEGQNLVASAQASSQTQIAQAQAESEKKIAQAQTSAEKRKMEADLAATIQEKQAEIASGFLTNGINETAWAALRAKVEIQAMKATQTAEKKRLDTELGATVTAADAVAGAATTAAQQNLAITQQKLATEQSAYATQQEALTQNKLKSIEGNWQQYATEWSVDKLKHDMKAKRERESDWGGRFADAITPTLSRSNEMIEDQAKNGIDLGNGIHSNTYDYANDPRLAGALADFKDQFGGDFGEYGFWDGVKDIFGFGDDELRYAAIEAFGVQQKLDAKLTNIATQTEARLGDIEANKNFAITMSKANYGAQASQIAVNTQQQLSQIHANMQKQLTSINAQATAEIEKRWIEAGKNVQEAWIEMAQKMEGTVSEMEARTNDYGLSVGKSTARSLQAYEKVLLSSVKELTHKFAVDDKEYLEMRQGYNEATSRNSELTDDDIGQISALSKYFGHDAGFVAQYAGSMEIFNQGVDSSVDRLDKAMQKVNKIGLNGRKFAKEIVQNLKLAQKYNFKDGTQGLMRMTQWAMKTRFNMESLSSMLDKVLDGGLEGVLEQSSRFQVLGGNAAVYSDPFGMMYDALSDPEAYAQRMQNMTKGFGSVDRKTGETTFNGTETLQMREIAKLQGRDVSEVMDEVRARNRRESVKLAMTAQQKGRFSEDQLDYMGNVAHYSAEKGGFAVNVYKGNGEFEEKSINDLTEEDIKRLQPVEHNEKMEFYMQSLLSAVERVTGEEIQEKADFAVTTFNALMANFTARAQKAHEEYAKNRDALIKKATDYWYEATMSMDDLLSSALGNANSMDQATEQAASAVNHFAEAVENATRRINGGSSGSSGSVNDAYIAANGHPMFGRASNVTPINDGYVTNPADEGLIGKSGGWVDKLINGIYTMVRDMYNGRSGGNMNLNINGALRLESNGQSIDLITILRNDPMLTRELTSMVLRQAQINNLGGKADNPINNGGRNTITL